MAGQEKVRSQIDPWQKKQRDQYPIAEPMKKSTELVYIPMNIGTTPSTEIEMCFVHLLALAARPHVSPRWRLQIESSLSAMLFFASELLVISVNEAYPTSPSNRTCSMLEECGCQELDMAEC